MYPESVIKINLPVTLFNRSGLYHRIKTPGSKIIFRITEVKSFVIYRIS